LKEVQSGVQNARRPAPTVKAKAVKTGKSARVVAGVALSRAIKRQSMLEHASRTIGIAAIDEVLRSHGCCNGLGLHEKEISGCPEEPVMRVVKNMT